MSSKNVKLEDKEVNSNVSNLQVSSNPGSNNSSLKQNFRILLKYICYFILEKQETNLDNLFVPFV